MRGLWNLVSSALLVAAEAHAQQRMPPPTSAPGAPPPPAPAPPPPAPPPSPPPPSPPPGYPPYQPYPGYPPPYPGYAPYPQSGYGYQPPGPPRTLHYEEGQPIPPGYYLEESVRRGPIIAGIIVLAVPYAIGFSVASALDFQDTTAWLLVPVVGPWLTLATREDVCDPGATYCDDDRAIRTLLVLDGLVQGTGAALLVWGMTSTTKRLVRQDMALQIGPRRVGTGYGIGAVARFF
jgi:hypothetical protein